MIIFKLGKHIKSAILGILRNFWMSFSATTAVAVTLTLVALFTLLYITANSFIDSIEGNITIRAMVDNGYDTTKIYNAKTHKDPLGDKLKAIPGVGKIEFSSKDAELEKFAKISGSENATIFERFKDKNPMSNVYRITLKDNNSDYSGVTEQVKKVEGIKSAEFGTGGVHKLVNVFGQVNSVMIFFMAALLLLTVFLISNTIKLTIYARKTEIQIMRLVGAANGYIRFPFILEGIIIGMIGAIIPAALTAFGYGKILETYSSGFVVTSALKLANMSTVNMVALSLFGIGALVGMLGSLISVGRYLKA